MQEYLRHNQINLVFFEIKPLQKNKKLIHLFVYQNIFHFEDNDSGFGSQNELDQNGFLQLFMYLHQRKFNFNKFKVKKNYKINYSGIFNKNKFTTFQKIIQPNYKKYFKKWKKNSWQLKKKNPQVYEKKLLNTKRKLLTKRIFMKRLVLDVQNIWDTVFKFNKRIKYQPNINKNKKFYKKIRVRLAWKLSKMHFRNVKKYKKKYKKTNKWWLRKHKNKFKPRTPKLSRRRIIESTKLFLRGYQKILKKIKNTSLKKKSMRVPLPKSQPLRTDSLLTKRKIRDQKYVTKNIVKNLISFLRIFKKLTSSSKKLSSKRIKKTNEIKTYDNRSLRIKKPKKKKKKFLKIKKKILKKF